MAVQIVEAAAEHEAVVLGGAAFRGTGGKGFLMDRIHRDLIDGYDEELELEFEDRTLAALTGDTSPDFTLESREG